MRSKGGGGGGNPRQENLFLLCLPPSPPPDLVNTSNERERRGQGERWEKGTGSKKGLAPLPLKWSAPPRGRAAGAATALHVSDRERGRESDGAGKFLLKRPNVSGPVRLPLLVGCFRKFNTIALLQGSGILRLGLLVLRVRKFSAYPPKKRAYFEDFHEAQNSRKCDTQLWQTPRCGEADSSPSEACQQRLKVAFPQHREGCVVRAQICSGRL